MLQDETGFPSLPSDNNHPKMPDHEFGCSYSIWLAMGCAQVMLPLITWDPSRWAATGDRAAVAREDSGEGASGRVCFTYVVSLIT